MRIPILIVLFLAAAVPATAQVLYVTPVAFVSESTCRPDGWRQARLSRPVRSATRCNSPGAPSSCRVPRSTGRIRPLALSIPLRVTLQSRATPSRCSLAGRCRLSASGGRSVGRRSGASL